MIGMHPFERGASPGTLHGGHSGQCRLEVRSVAVSYRLCLEKQADFRPQVRDPIRGHLKTSGYGRRIDVSLRQIHVSPPCGSRNTSNRHT
jgi:hypothetical protein